MKLEKRKQNPWLISEAIPGTEKAQNLSDNK